jgi:hypothetical protein
MAKNLQYSRNDHICDGIQVTFATTHVFVGNSPLVFLNAILLQLGKQYTEGADYKSIILLDPQEDGDELVIIYVIASTQDEDGGDIGSDFQTQMALDALSVFFNSTEFGEIISYTPYGGTAKSIKAIVDRQRLRPDPEVGGRILSNQIEILIVNDATNGVAAINKGRDIVLVPEFIGGANVSWVVVDIIKHDEAIWHLLMEK